MVKKGKRLLRGVCCAVCAAVLFAVGGPGAFAQQAGGVGIPAQEARIEQVQAELPLLEAWVYAPPGATAAETTATLGGKPLAVEDLRPYDAATDATSWYFLVDCSTSITPAQMQAVQECIAGFAASMPKQDNLTLVTFGDAVEVPLLRETSAQAVEEAVRTLAPDRPGTLFFDAIAKAVELSAAGEPLRREIAFVFSDSVDYNLGGYTKAEVDEKLAQSGLPVYAFGFDTGEKQQLDDFGAVARASGGAIRVADAAGLPAAFDETLAEIERASLLRLSAASNVIDETVQALSVQLPGGAAERDITLLHWAPDTEPPVLLRAEQQSEGSIRLVFSEAVQSAGLAASYEVLRENGDLVGVGAAAYNEADHSAVLTLAQPPPSGVLTVRCPGVADVSMEKNAVAGELALPFEGPPPAPEEPRSADGTPLAWLLLAVAGMAAVVGIGLAVVKKRGGFVVKGGKLHFASEAVVEQELAAAPGAKVHVVQKTARPVKARLDVCAANGQTRKVDVDIAGTLFVGRSDICDVFFDDAAMSRQHFVIGEENGVFTIANLSQSGPTVLNGVPVHKPHALHDGDVIEAGGTKLIFRPGADAQALPLH